MHLHPVTVHKNVIRILFWWVLQKNWWEVTLSALWSSSWDKDILNKWTLLQCSVFSVSGDASLGGVRFPHLIPYSDFVLGMCALEAGIMSASFLVLLAICQDNIPPLVLCSVWLDVPVKCFLSVPYSFQAPSIHTLNSRCSQNLLELLDFKWHFLKDCGIGMSSCFCVQCCCNFFDFICLWSLQ